MRVILLDPGEAEDLHHVLQRALTTGQSVRFAQDGEGIKVKIGYGTWSPSLGVIDVDD